MDLEKVINESLEDNFSGTILIIKDGEIIFNKNYGYRDWANKIENDNNTIFGTASAGKAFVAVGIIQLIEQGFITLETKISEIFPNAFSNIDKDVIIKQLLNHTSGIGDYFDEDEINDYSELWKNIPNYNIRKNDDIIPLFIDKKMKHNPGEMFEYNNTGYIILAKIIEEISKISFDVYIKKNIFDISEMNNTGYYELDRLPSNTATGYIYDEEKNEYYSNIYSIDVKGTGAGGCFTTLKDIYLFWKSLLNNKLVNEYWKKEMLSIQALNDNCNYGYGFWINSLYDELFPYIQGSDPGVSFISSYLFKEKVMTAVVSNFENNVWVINKKIIRAIKKLD